MTAMVEVWSRMALRLANADILPYDLRPYARTVQSFLDSVAEIEGASDNLDLPSAGAAVDRWLATAEALQAKTEAALSRDGAVNPDQYQAVNRTLLAVERQFLFDEGIPGRPWFKHLLYAPRYTYDALSLPGVREAAERRDWPTATRQLAIVVERIEAVTRLTEQAAAELERPGQTGD